MRLQLRQDVFCDCGLDILEYSVVEIRDSSDGTFYKLRSKKGVGRYSSIEIIVYETSFGELKYLELANSNDESCEYGLEPFTHGKYFTTISAAKSSFAKTQIDLIQERENKLANELAELKSRKAKWEKML